MLGHEIKTCEDLYPFFLLKLTLIINSKADDENIFIRVIRLEITK